MGQLHAANQRKRNTGTCLGFKRCGTAFSGVVVWFGTNDWSENDVALSPE